MKQILLSLLLLNVCSSYATTVDAFTIQKEGKFGKTMHYKGMSDEKGIKTLQYDTMKKENPDSLGFEERDFSAEPIVYYTFGMGPCMGIAVVDPTTHWSAFMHLDSLKDNPVEYLQNELNGIINNSHFSPNTVVLIGPGDMKDPDLITKIENILKQKFKAENIKVGSGSSTEAYFAVDSIKATLYNGTFASKPVQNNNITYYNALISPSENSEIAVVFQN